MPINGVALAAIAGGSLFLYSGIKGKSILATLVSVTKGQSPATVKQTNTITPLAPSLPASASSSAINSSTPIANAGSSASSYQNYAFALFPQFGWGTDQQDPLIKLWNQESGWNPNAQNPTSTAYGIAQFLDSTWGPYGSKTSDPSLQIKYGLEYIRDRYHDPAGAWLHEQQNNWY